MFSIIGCSDGFAIGISNYSLRDNTGMKYPGFARRLNELLIDAKGHMSQAEAGKYLGVSQPTYHSWINGEAMPGMPKAIEIASKLNCCVEYLLTGNGPKRFTVDIEDETHKRILTALRAVEVAIARHGGEDAKNNRQALYRFALDRAMVGDVTEEQLAAFIQFMSSD